MYYILLLLLRNNATPSSGIYSYLDFIPIFSEQYYEKERERGLESEKELFQP